MKILALLFLLAGGLHAAAPVTLPELVDRTVRDVRAEFARPPLQPDQVAVTVIDLRDPARPVEASYRGDANFYPASVIKLFFLAYAQRLMEDGRLADTPELRRGLHDMIVHSSNDATSYVVDAITGTTSGPELPPVELAAWSAQRNAVTDYFRALGYASVNARRKTWGEGPYGRESQDALVHLPARNSLSTRDTARLLQEIALGRCVSAARSAQMRELLARDPAQAAPDDPDDQATAFTGQALGPGMKLWSKAGWVSRNRHDAALIGLPDGGQVIIVTFTEGKEHAANRAIIAAVARRILAGLPPVVR